MQSIISVLSGIGDKDAPVGTKPWATYFSFYAKQRAEDATRNVCSLQKALRELKENEAHKALGLDSWDALCQQEIGITADQAEKVLAAPPDATVGMVLGDRPGAPASTPRDQSGRYAKSDIVRNGDKTLGKVGGNSAEYLTARLDRDRPDIAAQVHAGELSARKGAILAGIIRELSPLEKAQAAFRRLSKPDRDAFDLWRAEQPL